MEAAASLALFLSGAEEEAWETPTAEIVKAKKTYRPFKLRLEIKEIIEELKKITMIIKLKLEISP